MREIMRAHNRIIPRSLLYPFYVTREQQVDVTHSDTERRTQTTLLVLRTTACQQRYTVLLDDTQLSLATTIKTNGRSP